MFTEMRKKVKFHHIAGHKNRNLEYECDKDNIVKMCKLCLDYI